jgi:hypothetical protein
MTTATIEKTIVKPTWTVEKLHEEFARVSALNMVATMTVLGKIGGEKAIEELQTVMRSNKIEHLKGLGVKTPIELVKHMAEFEANVFGSIVEIWGDEKAAHMTYKTCGMWQAIEKHAHLSKEQLEVMGSKMQNCMSLTAKEFGLNAEVVKSGDLCTVNFTK